MREFSGNPKEQGPKKPKPKANEALALALAAALSGTTPADAQDASRFATPSLAIREASQHAVPQQRVVMPALKDVSNPQRVLSAIRNVEEASIPGGIYERDFNDSNLTQQRLADIMDDQSRAAAFLTMTNDKVLSVSPELRTYMAPKEIPGHRKLRLTMNAGGHGICNSIDAVVDGKPTNITAAHCLQDTREEGSYFFLSVGPDVAVKDIKLNPTTPMLVLDSRVTDEAVTGRIALIDTVDRYDRRVRFATYFNRMTEPVMKILFTSKLPADERKRLMNGFWHVAPPQQGELATNGTGFNFQGESGNPVVVRVPILGEGAYGLSGTFHSGIGRGAQCTNKYTGTCITVQFSAGPDTVREVVRMNRALHQISPGDVPKQKLPTEGWEAEIKKIP